MALWITSIIVVIAISLDQGMYSKSDMKLYGTIYRKAWIDGANCATEHGNNGILWTDSIGLIELHRDSLEFMEILK